MQSKVRAGCCKPALPPRRSHARTPPDVPAARPTGCWRTEPDEPGADVLMKLAACLALALLTWLGSGPVAAALGRLWAAVAPAVAAAAGRAAAAAATLLRAAAAPLLRLVAASPLVDIVVAALVCVALATGGLLLAEAAGLVRQPAFSLVMREGQPDVPGLEETEEEGPNGPCSVC